MTARRKAAAKPGPRVRTALPAVTLWMAAGMLLMLGARAREGRPVYLLDLAPFVLWGCASLFFAAALRLGRYRGVRALPGLVLMLSGIGVWVRSRMLGSVEEVTPFDLAVYPMGVVWMTLAWAFFRRGRFGWTRRFWPLAYLLSLGVVAALMVVGGRFRGALYGPGGMTPTELLKILMPLAMAGYFASTEAKWRDCPAYRPPVGQLILLAGAGAALLGLLVIQRDLGMGVLLGLTLVGMLVAATGRGSWALAAAVPMAAGIWAVRTFFAHGARRLEAWMDPFADPTGAGWQVLQGLSGLYAGGVTGTGLGEGRPDRLPIAGSDFIYAVYGEEMGFVGCVLLLVLYGMLLRQGFRAAERCTETYTRLAATAITLLLAVQVAVNIAGVVTLLPVTGIPLPWLSLGGSSAWVTSLQLGVLLALSEPPESSRKGGGKRKKGRATR